MDIQSLGDTWHHVIYDGREGYILAVYESPPLDWSRIFFKLQQTLGMSKKEIKELTLPQLERYMLLLEEHVEFTFRYNADSTAYGIGKAFGGSDDKGKPDDDFEDADEDNMKALEQIFGGF